MNSGIAAVPSPVRPHNAMAEIAARIQLRLKLCAFIVGSQSFVVILGDFCL